MKARLVLPVLAALAIPVAAALAAEAAGGAGRYELAPNDSGFIRLDTVTGAASHCAPVNGNWVCEPLATENGAGAKLDALATEVSRLSSALTALADSVAVLAAEGRQPAMEPVAPVAINPDAPPATSFIATILEKFLVVVRTLKHGDAA